MSRSDDLCQVRNCRHTWTRETPHGLRCELHANVAGHAPRPAPEPFVRPAAVPLPPPPGMQPPPRRAPPPPRREVAGRLTHNTTPDPGMCCALRDGEPCDRPAVKCQRGLCVGCRKLASRRGILDDVAMPPKPGYERAKRKPTLPVDEIVRRIAEGQRRVDIIREFGLKRDTADKGWARWTAQAAAMRGCA